MSDSEDYEGDDKLWAKLKQTTRDLNAKMDRITEGTNEKLKLFEAKMKK